MRVQVEDRPRIESTSTSSTASRSAMFACFFFHLSRPARAAALSGELATTIKGILTRDFLAADLAREGATRGPSFHHFELASEGARRSTARDNATAARRTSAKLQRGSMRTLTCIPREPLVLGQPRSPISSRKL